MTLSKELYLATLSMDAYNRGYGAGIADGGEGDADGLGESGQIGSARVIIPSAVGRDDPTSAAWQAAGFYAVAYTMGSGPDVPPELQGKTIISYRGTDFTPKTDFAADQTEDWPLGAGNFLHDQTRLAKEFLYAVQPEDGLKSVILTGPSPHRGPPCPP
jgi:hypothetical protein